MPYWEPVKLPQYWRDVLAPASASDETCGSILNSLKTLNQAVGNAGQQKVAVVEAQRYKCVATVFSASTDSTLMTGHTVYWWSVEMLVQCAFRL